MDSRPQFAFAPGSFLKTLIAASTLFFGLGGCTEMDQGEDWSAESAALTACTLPSFVAAQPAPIGWASQNGGTKGGGTATPTVVTTLSAFNTAAKGTTAAVIYVSGNLGQGTYTIGSNKTIIGCSGTTPTLGGHVGLATSTNVIIRNLNIVGYNCAPPEVNTATGGQCQNGTDAMTIDKSSKNIWVDHNAISNGSDGNMDITHGSDFITVSYTKFSYSSARTDPNDTGAMGHRVSNLVGHSDSNTTEDTGKLNVTWHHNWWSSNVMERQPRVRFGKNHIYNNLYTSTGNNYCIGAGYYSNILDEGNVFVGSKTPIELQYANASTIILSRNNLYSGTSGVAPADKGAGVFTPPYSYSAQAASAVQADVQANAGPK